MTKRKKSTPTRKTLSEENILHWYYRNIDLSNRTIFFGPWQPSEELIDEAKTWEVNDWSSQNMIKGLYTLEHMSNDPIKIIWTSCGGDVDAGMAIYDKMKESPCEITMECYGRVRSMGTVILQAAKNRRISRNCLFMIHYGTAGIDSVHTHDFERFAERIKFENGVMEDIYLGKIREKDPSFTRDQLAELIKYDKYMKPSDAVQIGLADEVI